MNCDYFPKKMFDRCLAQGKGIFLINKMSQIKKWSRDDKSVPTGSSNIEMIIYTTIFFFL